MTDRPVMLAGAPTHNPWLYHRVPFNMGDPMAFFYIPGEGTFAILRDIEIDRFVNANITDHAAPPAEYAPATGLSGDRDTATAQAAAEFLVRKGVREIWTDRSLPEIFAHFARDRGIDVTCDPEMGVLARRSKSDREVEHLRAAQSLTEQAVRHACELIAMAKAGPGGALERDGDVLTSEGIIAEINVWLLRHGMDTSNSIVANSSAS